MGRNSRKLPGQPWRKSKGMALGEVEKRATKWIVWGSCVVTVVVKCGKVLMWASDFFLGVC